MEILRSVIETLRSCDLEDICKGLTLIPIVYGLYVTKNLFLNEERSEEIADLGPRPEDLERSSYR